MEKFGVLNWCILIAFLVGKLLLGFFMSKKIDTAEDYYAAQQQSDKCRSEQARALVHVGIRGV